MESHSKDDKEREIFAKDLLSEESGLNPGDKEDISNSNSKSLWKSIDWISTIVPLAIVSLLCVLFFISPMNSTYVLEKIRGFLNNIGVYYIVLGCAFLLVSLFIGFSKYGKIKLGKNSKPQYSSFQWGTMIFTSTMAADILFYSLCEWALYANETHVASQGAAALWLPTYSLFHWGPIAWSCYVVLAAAFGFMLHVRGKNKQKFSEACRPLFGKKIDGVFGKIIDLFAIFALIAGTATTFSLSIPLLARALGKVLHIPASTLLTIVIMILIAIVYSLAVWFGMKGISRLATWCIYVFIGLLLYVFFGGGEAIYIIESGVASVGNLLQNFIGLSTWVDPLKTTTFAQDWTIFYWAYWMVWCVATPFFIASISKGRTIRNVVFGTYGWGLAGTFTSFIVLGNYGLAQQLKHGLDVSGMIAETGDISGAILRIFSTLPVHELGLILLSVTMIFFYSTTFDALTMVISYYSYKRLAIGKEPDKRVRIFWALVFVLLPIALVFAENSMNHLQSVSIIAAFPMGIIILLIAFSFFKDAGKYLGGDRNTIRRGMDKR